MSNAGVPRLCNLEGCSSSLARPSIFFLCVQEADRMLAEMEKEESAKYSKRR